MKRFITYLFFYEDGTKGKNAGFIRTDIRNGICKMEIHIRNVGRFQGRAQVFWLVKGTKPTGIESGRIVMTMGKGDGTFSFVAKSLMESSYDFSDVCGVGIRFGNQHYAASFWEDEVDEGYLNGSFALWVPEEVSQAQEAADPPQEQEASPNTCSQLRKIDMNGIRSLPKKNWYLSNNSFLLHGFFNYHYLVVKETECDGEKKCYLGIPGYYARQEKALAGMFGFPEFEAENEAEPVEDGTFGYWLCLLDE